MNEWPHRSVTGLIYATPELARGLANDVREATDQSLNRALDMNVVTKLGRFHTYIAGSPAGNLEALLIPRFSREDDSFRIELFLDRPEKMAKNLECSVDVAKNRREEIKRHRVSHEIGHSFFYFRAPGKAPDRIFSYPRPMWGDDSNPTKEGSARSQMFEEKFCEEFARQLLVPREALKRLSSDPERIAKRFEVSLAMAKSALNKGPVVRIVRPKYGTPSWKYTVPS